MGQASSIPSPPPPAANAMEGCPMRAGQTEISPLNRMPTTPEQTPSATQSIILPLKRTISSIPKANSNNSEIKIEESSCPIGKDVKKDSSSWEYPSPQQFYNALVRKGWETPEESVEMMVNIHNWLNEEAWQQVRTWEERQTGGDRSQLARFEGRPQDVSPKARYHQILGSIFPSSYHSMKPFDRHDWHIHRPLPSSSTTSSYTAPSSTQAYTTHRYVIDYYSLPDDAAGNPVFSLDVRPALDDFEAVKERLSTWWTLKKEKFSGGEGAGMGIGVKVQEEK